MQSTIFILLAVTSGIAHKQTPRITQTDASGNTDGICPEGCNLFRCRPSSCPPLFTALTYSLHYMHCNGFTAGIRMLHELSDDTLLSGNDPLLSGNDGDFRSSFQPIFLTEDSDPVGQGEAPSLQESEGPDDSAPGEDFAGDEEKAKAVDLFRSSNIGPDEPPLDNWGITTDTIREVQNNLENYLRSYTADKKDLETSLYNLNGKSRL
ncbi:hypothetical protein GNI_067220 [Gregarina niphandrodes]|uniref:Transmembrane protein n=1 Tax=Gregarina niphandrodes TaxID=110365 RepID=A0A023B7N3_GRENI|nr:hypothetical protein GNI_067220 [Gregarina niphandrodes]EZG67626.1 hypothetical protein GNI_067220 [Gregarina niphandrodes]|eukprot:XP_011130179.1 hypothetical protein GNI_067220 [Gregarina niphandrodes]